MRNAFKSDNIEVMVCDKADEVIEERFESLLSGYQIGLETSMRSSKFILEKQMSWNKF